MGTSRTQVTRVHLVSSDALEAGIFVPVDESQLAALVDVGKRERVETAAAARTAAP